MKTGAHIPHTSSHAKAGIPNTSALDAWCSCGTWSLDNAPHIDVAREAYRKHFDEVVERERRDA